MTGRLFCCVALAGVSLLFGGCASVSSPLVDSAALLFSPDHGAATIPEQPDPRYSFLRVQVSGYPPGMLALGFIDEVPGGSEAPVLVWYSAQHEVLRTQDGRIVANTGTPFDWSALRWIVPPPAWRGVGDAGYRYSRERDVLPDYEFGLREVVLGSPIAMPDTDQLPVTLPATVAQSLRWYKEVPYMERAGGQAGSATLPPSIFGWGQYAGESMVVYSEQWLTPEVSIRIQRWPVTKGAQ